MLCPTCRNELSSCKDPQLGWFCGWCGIINRHDLEAAAQKAMNAKISPLPVSVDFEERYEIGRQLWLDGPHGGWLALDRLLGREVVLNRPYGRDDHPWFVHMAQIRAQIRHANLIPLYDLGATKDGRPFFTEPDIKAADIRRLQREGEGKAADVMLPRLVSYLLDVGKALAFLHASGFLHLELHPGNVLVAPESQEVFLVRGHPSLPPVTTEGDGGDAGPNGVRIGVPAYMAPEQLDPHRLGAPDHLTDVYGLGGILFEILYDNPPNGRHGAPVTEVLTALAVRKGPPPRGTFGPWAARCREMARKLEPVCLRALEHDRTARQASVSALVSEVEQRAWGWPG